MSGTTYNTIALFGAGSVGHFLDAFVNLTSSGVKIIVLTRSSSSKTFPSSVIVAPIANYDDVDEVSKVLREHGVQVVVSTVGVEGHLTQKSVADAAKKAGVELFVPSEFSFVSEDVRDGGLMGLKQLVVDHLKEIGIPYLRIWTGTWYMYIKDLTGYNVNGKVSVVLSGDEEFSLTSEKDIAGFTAYIVTRLPPSSLHNRNFRIQGEKSSLKKIAEILSAEVVQVDDVPSSGKYKDFLTELQKFTEGGKASSGFVPSEGKEGIGENAAGSANGLWEGHHWVTLREYLTE